MWIIVFAIIVAVVESGVENSSGCGRLVVAQSNDGGENNLESCGGVGVK